MRDLLLESVDEALELLHVDRLGLVGNLRRSVQTNVLGSFYYVSLGVTNAVTINHCVRMF